MDNRTAAEYLREIGDLIELGQDEPFKARAYHQAARTLAGLDEPAEALLDRGTLGELPGFGRAMVAKLGELFKAGQIAYLEELRASVPPGLAELRKVAGLGPKKIRLIHRKLGVTSLAQLREAVVDGRLLELPGFGPKSLAKLSEGIRQVERFAGQCRYPEAERTADEVAARLSALGKEVRVAVTGAVRRRMETVAELSWLVAGAEAGPGVRELLGGMPGCGRCDPEGEERLRLHFAGGIAGTVRFTSPDRFDRLLFTETGPPGYVDWVDTRVSDWNGTEEEFLARAGLPFLPPECRDQEAFWRTGTPLPLVTDLDIRGTLHCHSDYSDGEASLKEMAEGCRARGLQYIGICDHSQSAGYAGGLSVEQVARQHEEIDRLNGAYAGSFRIFKGIEADIRADGSLDYPDTVLEAFDFVVASIHSQLDMDPATATRRTLRAIAHPATTILGHPTGRLLLVREGFTLDWERVFEAAAHHQVAVEINANPRRLDLDWRLLPACLAAGIRTSINPDAHHVEGIDDMRFGVAAARKGGARPQDVLNCLSTAKLEAFFRGRRR